MMKEHKIRQEIYHRVNREHDDDLKNFDIIISDKIVNDAVKYFTTKEIGWVYPGKSYMVGICYSKWLSKEFGGDPLDYLKDPELLYNNDPYFKPYQDDMNTYDSILEIIGGWNFNETTGLVPDVKKYFIKEFGMDDEFGI
jgi:hypothetical protein